MSFAKSFLILAAVFSLLPCAASAAIYDIANYPADQGGWTLSGTITTSNLGDVATVESADVTLSNGSQSELLDTYVGYFGMPLAVMGNSLVVPNGGGFNLQAQATYPSVSIQEFNLPGFSDYIGGIALGTNLGWSQPYYWDIYPTAYNSPGAQSSVVGNYIGSAPMIVGTLVTPEPTSLVVWSLLGAIGLLIARRRRKA